MFLGEKERKNAMPISEQRECKRTRLDERINDLVLRLRSDFKIFYRAPQ